MVTNQYNRQKTTLETKIAEFLHTLQTLMYIKFQSAYAN